MAGRDAWIAVPLAGAAGIMLFGLYAAIARIYPGQTLIGSARSALGPVAGTIVGALYVWFFLHLGALVIRNLVELYATAIMLQTPILVFAVVMVSLAAMAVSLGLEVIARAAEVLTFLFLTATLLLDGLVFATPNLARLDRFLPILENGPLPVVQSAVAALAFPYGEAVLFIPLIAALAAPKRGLGIAAWGIGVATFTLTMVMIRNIAVLGANHIARQSIPSLTTLTLVNLGEFIQRIDALVILVWTYGIFAKFMIVYYALASSLAELTRLATYRPLVLPLGIILVTLSLVVYQNFGEMVSFATQGYPAYAFIFELVLPVLILAVGAIRTRRGRACPR